MNGKLNTIDGKLDTILNNVTIKEIPSNYQNILASELEAFKTLNENSTTTEQMEHIINYLKSEGYLK